MKEIKKTIKKDTQPISHGMMSGSNEGIMEALYDLLPEDNPDIETFGARMNYDLARQYMSELWARDISKQDFLE